MLEGWIKLHRKIITSDIYRLPPMYLKVFERMVLEANHKDVYIPYKSKYDNTIKRKLIKRGEKLTSLRIIAEWVKWYVRGKEYIPNTKIISEVLQWLKENDMIKIYNEGNRKETHYIIVNYSTYQDSECTEVTQNTLETKQIKDTNNNVKKEEKTTKDKVVISPTGYKEKNYFWFVVDLLLKISRKDKSNCLAIIKKLLIHKKGDEYTYLQKCLMLIYVINKNVKNINESKYIGILVNQYRELSYEEYKRNLYSDNNHAGIKNTAQEGIIRINRMERLN